MKFIPNVTGKKQPAKVGKAKAVSVPLGQDSETKQSKCPFQPITSKFAKAPPKPKYTESGGIVTPGPPAASLESVLDVIPIISDGLHQAMANYDKKYGPAARFANPTDLNGASGWLFINGPDDVQHVCLQNVANYQARYLPDIYKFITNGKGILGSEGDYNRKHRRMCSPPFSAKQQLEEFAEVTVKRSQEVVEIWQEHLKDREDFDTDLANQMQRLTLDVVGLTAFSYDFNQVKKMKSDFSGEIEQQKRSTDALLWAVNTFGESLASMFITPMPLLNILDKLRYPQLMDLKESVVVMREKMMEIIANRRSEIEAGCDTKSDLLDFLLRYTSNDGEPLNDEELWEDVHDVMGAGHETTATTTATILFLITQHPEVEAKVVEEIERVLGDRPITYEDIDNMPYMTQCIHEALRMYPAIPVFPRVAEEADMLPSGHEVFAGDVVFMSNYALGTKKELWGEDVEEYNPDRFGGERGEAIHPYQFLPFGAGPRMCLGPQFAMMTVQIMVTTILQKIKFNAIYPRGQKLKVEYDITMNFNPTNGLKVKVMDR